MPLVGRLETDSRVRKTAVSVQEAGQDVTVLVADRRLSRRRWDEVDGVRVLTVPMAYAADLDRKARNKRNRLRRPWPLVPRDERERNATRVRARARNLRWAGGGLPLRLLRAPMWAGHQVRDRAFDVYERWAASFWAWWDGPRGRNAFVRRPSSVVPMIDDACDALTREIWRLEPDIVHVHDVFPLEAASLAVQRMRRAGREVRLVYDSHEYVAGVAGPNQALRDAWHAVESRAMPSVDAIVTVSDVIADALQRDYRRTVRPTVTLNTPLAKAVSTSDRQLREDCGLGPEDKLVVYSGGIAAHRGLDVVIDAVARIDGLHLAIVYVPFIENADVQRLRNQIAERGIGERAHLVEPVSPENVVAFLRSADIGVHPLSKGPQNHDMALPNKLFDYIHAGLALVVSDVELMSRFVNERAIGTSFVAGDAGSCEMAIRQALADLPRYRAATADPRLREEFSWETQAEGLANLYRSLTTSTARSSGRGSPDCSVGEATVRGAYAKRLSDRGAGRIGGT